MSLLYQGPEAKAIISLAHTDFIIPKAGVMTGGKPSKRNGKKKSVRIKKGKIQKPGVVKVYARWCGHCRDKERCIIEMANALANSNMGLSVYVIDCADEEQKPLTNALGIQGFPTFLNCDADGTLSEFSEEVHDVQSVLDAICPECRSQEAFGQDCFKR
jgi:thiol-disulfide isomerase/thioredoxin